MVFDLLWLDGESLLDLPYLERRERLLALELDRDHVKVPANYIGEGTALLAASREQDVEGIVAKRLDSAYVPGGRRGEWLKIKNVSSQELVIGGWLPGKKGRSGRLGALLVGHYERAATAPQLCAMPAASAPASPTASWSASARSCTRVHGRRARSWAPSRRGRHGSCGPTSSPRSSSASGRGTAPSGTPPTRG